MKIYSDLKDFDLLAMVEAVKPEMCGRNSAISDGYRGQFFWHIDSVSCTDWLASYIFEDGKIEPGEQGLCKVVLADHVKKSANNNFPVGTQFAIREGSRIVAVGKVLENHANE